MSQQEYPVVTANGKPTMWTIALAVVLRQVGFGIDPKYLGEKDFLILESTKGKGYIKKTGSQGAFRLFSKFGNKGEIQGQVPIPLVGSRYSVTTKRGITKTFYITGISVGRQD